MQLLIIGLLLLGVFLATLQMAAKQTRSRRSLPMVFIILGFLFLCFGVFIVITMQVVGSINVLYLMLAVLSIVVFGRMILFFLSHLRELNKNLLLVFVAYLFVVLVLTIFSRHDLRQTVVQTEVLEGLPQAIRTHSIAPMTHMLENVLLFVPLGLLFPMLHPKLRYWNYSFLNGAMLSILIETIQMLARLGECDIDDILANTLGAVVGYWVFKLIYPYIKHKLN